jgi:hypothetical protein
MIIETLLICACILDQYDYFYMYVYLKLFLIVMGNLEADMDIIYGHLSILHNSKCQ